MGFYRAFRPCFWSDTKIANDFSILERYFYLYLLTNEHTNLLGCYEISVKQMANETDIDKGEVVKLLDRLHTEYNVVAFSNETKELLIYNWHKYNWTKSGDLINGLKKQVETVKSQDFREYLSNLIDGVIVVNRRSKDGHEEENRPSTDHQESVYRPSTDGGETSDSVAISIDNTPDITVLPDNLSDTPKVTTNKPDTTKKPSKKSDKPEVYDFKKHSNTDNLKYFLDTTDKDYSAITDNPVIVEAVDLWLNYKTEEHKFTYTEPGLQTTLSLICSNVKKHGAEAVAYAIQMSISKTYKGIVFDLIPGRKEGNNSVGGNQRVGYKTKLQMQQEDMQQTYDLAREFANSGGIIDD